MWQKLKRFCEASLFNKLHSLSTFYYQMKGIALYRLLFKEFGEGSCIRKPLLISNPGHMRIGDRVSIREGARLEVVRSRDERIPELNIGNDSSVEQNVHIVCHSRIHIGERVAISANCCILDVTHTYEDVPNLIKIVDRIRDENSFVEIGDDTLIGYGAVILPNVSIGKHVVIGSNSVVTRDIPDFTVAVGSPARIVKRYEPASARWVRVPGEVEVKG
jgi:acetyltransferase-like isoleucine patch superfamily enzyme